MKHEYMSYEEYLVNVKKGIVTKDGNCPVTPLLLMRFTEMGRDLMPVFYEIMRWGFKHEADIPQRLTGGE